MTHNLRIGLNQLSLDDKLRIDGIAHFGMDLNNVKVYWQQKILNFRYFDIFFMWNGLTRA